MSWPRGPYRTPCKAPRTQTCSSMAGCCQARKASGQRMISIGPREGSGQSGWAAQGGVPPQAQVSLSDRWELARSTETWKPDSLAWAGEGEDALMNCREMVGRNRAGARPSPPEILVSFTWHPALRVLILMVRGLDRQAVSSGIRRLQGEVSGLRGVVAQPRPGHPDHGNSVFTSPRSLRTWGWSGGKGRGCCTLWSVS